MDNLSGKFVFLRRQNLNKILLGFVFALLVSGATQADEIKISNAWVSESAPGQDTASINLVITSKKNAKLVEVASGMAQNAEIHEIVVAGTSVTMRKLTEIDLPSKTPVKFDDDGLHLMLIGLRKQLVVGHQLPFALTVKFEDGRVTTLRVLAVIKTKKKQKSSDSKTVSA
jgi:copper(I)-binding protein